MKQFLSQTCLLPCAAWLTAAGAAAILPAAAANSAAPVPAANAALRALAAHINAEPTLSFTATDTRYAAGAETASYQIAGQLAKPNYLMLKVTPAVTGQAAGVPAATIASDGATYTVVNSATTQYVTAAAPKEGGEPDSPEAMYFLYKIVGGAGQAGLAVADALLSADFDITQDQVPAGIKRIVTTTSRSVMLNGTDYQDVAQKVVGARHTAIYETLFDPQINRLVQLKTYSVVNGAPKLSEQIAFNFKNSPQQAAAGQFAYAPPAGYLQYHAPAAPGSVASDFAVLRPDGSQVHLSDYKGKVVVIDFWATWCPPCLATLPGTDKLAAEYQPQGVVFMPVCTWDTRARFDAWLPKHSTWTMSWLFDTAGDDEAKSIATTRYAVSGIPTQYVIGKDGVIVYRGFADSDAGEKPMIDAINKAMAAS